MFNTLTYTKSSKRVCLSSSHELGIKVSPKLLQTLRITQCTQYTSHSSSVKLQIRSLKIYLLWNDCRPLAKVYDKIVIHSACIQPCMRSMSPIIFKLWIKCNKKVISLKEKKFFHIIIQFWDISEKNMENEQWQINRKKW